MLLKCASKAATEYGFPSEMQYNNDNFHGHQKAILVGIRNFETNEVTECNVPGNTEKEKTERFEKMLNDPRIMLLEEPIDKPATVDEKPTTYKYMLPYYVPSHSVYQPGILFENLYLATQKDTSTCFTVEVLLTTHGMNRYVHLKFNTTNVSVWDVIHESFEQDQEELEKQMGITYYTEEMTDSDHPYEGYYLDFYTEYGERVDIWRGNIRDFRDSIAAFRLIDIYRPKKGELNNGEIQEHPEC